MYDLEVGDRLDVALQDGTWAGAAWRGFVDGATRRFEVVLPARTTTDMLSFTPHLFAPLGRGRRRLVDIRGMMRRRLGGNAPETELLVAGEAFRRGIRLGAVVDAKSVKGPWFLGLIVDERVVPVAALFAGCGADGSGHDAPTAADAPPRMVSEEAIAAALAAGHEDPEHETVREVRVAFLGSDETDDVWLPAASPFLCRPGCRSGGSTMRSHDDGPVLFREQVELDDEHVVPLLDAAGQHPPRQGNDEYFALRSATSALQTAEADVERRVSEDLGDAAEEDADVLRATLRSAIEADADVIAAREAVATASQFKLCRRRPHAMSSMFASVLGTFVEVCVPVILRVVSAAAEGPGAAEAGGEAGGEAATGPDTAVSPAVLSVLVESMELASRHFTGPMGAVTLPTFVAAARAVVSGWGEAVVKELPAAGLQQAADRLGAMLGRATSFERGCELREGMMMEAARRFSRSTLQRRMEGLKIFGQLASMSRDRVNYPLGFWRLELSRPAFPADDDVTACQATGVPDALGLTWLRLNSNYTGCTSFRRTPIARAVRDTDVAAALEDEGILEGILVARHHEQLIKRSGDIFRFLCACGRLRHEPIEAAWDKAATIGGGYWSHLLGLFSEVAADVPWGLNVRLIAKARALPASAIDEPVISLLYAIATAPVTIQHDEDDVRGLTVLATLSEAGADDADAPAGEDDAARASAVARLALAMLLSASHDSLDPELWPGACAAASPGEAGRSSGAAAAAAAAAAAGAGQGAAPASAAPSAAFACPSVSVAVAAEVNACRVLSMAKASALVPGYMDACVEDLKAGRSATRAISVLQHLIETHPVPDEEAEVDEASDDSTAEAEVSRGAVIHALEARHGLLAAILEEMGRMRTDAIAAAAAAGLEVLCAAPSDELEAWQDATHACDDAAASKEGQYREDADPVNALRPAAPGAPPAAVGFLAATRVRIRVLRLILAQSHEMLKLDQAVGLWRIAVVGALSVAQRRDALSWFAEGVQGLFFAAQLGSLTDAMFDGEVVHRLFTDEMVRPWFAPAATQPAFLLVNRSFLFVNSAHGRLEATQDSEIIHSLPLEGTDVLWGLALRSGSEGAAEQATGSLMRLIASLAPEIRSDAPALARSFVERCVRYIRGVIPEGVDVGPDLEELELSSAPSSPARGPSGSGLGSSSSRSGLPVSYVVDEVAGRTEEVVLGELARATRLVSRCVGVLNTLLTSTAGETLGMVPSLLPQNGEGFGIRVFGSVRVDGAVRSLVGATVRAYSHETAAQMIIGLATALRQSPRRLTVRVRTADENIFILSEAMLGRRLDDLGIDSSAVLGVFDTAAAITHSLLPPEAAGTDCSIDVAAMRHAVDASPAAVIASTPAFIGTLLGLIDATATGPGNAAPAFPLPFPVFFGVRSLVERLPAPRDMETRLRALSPRLPVDGLSVSAGADAAARTVRDRVALNVDSGPDAGFNEWDADTQAAALLSTIGTGSTWGAAPEDEARLLGFDPRELAEEAREHALARGAAVAEAAMAAAAATSAAQTEDRDGDTRAPTPVAAAACPELGPADWAELLDPSKPGRLFVGLLIAARMVEDVRLTASMASVRSHGRVSGDKTVSLPLPIVKVRRIAEPSAAAVEAEDTVRRAWVRRFVASGGAAHLISVVRSLSARLPTGVAAEAAAGAGLFGCVGDVTRPVTLARSDAPAAACGQADVTTLVSMNRAMVILAALGGAGAIATLDYPAAVHLRDGALAATVQPMPAPRARPFLTPVRTREADAASLLSEAPDVRKAVEARPPHAFPVSLVTSVQAAKAGIRDTAYRIKPLAGQLETSMAVPDALHLAVVLGRRAAAALAADARGPGTASLVTGELVPAGADDPALPTWRDLLEPSAAVFRLLARCKSGLAAHVTGSSCIWAAVATTMACLLDDGAASAALAAPNAPAASSAVPSVIHDARSALLRGATASATARARRAVSDAIVAIATHAPAPESSDPMAHPALGAALALIAGRPDASAEPASAAASEPYFDAAVGAVGVAARLHGMTSSAFDAVFAEAREALTAQILSAPARESRESKRVDRPLRGAMRLLGAILDAGTPEARAAASGSGLFAFLLGPALLEVPSVEELSSASGLTESSSTPSSPRQSAAVPDAFAADPPAGPDSGSPAAAASAASSPVESSLGPPLCKTRQSRKAAFELLSTLVTGNPGAVLTALRVLGSELAEAVEDGSAKVSSFRFNPLADAKSGAGYVGLSNPGCLCYMNSLNQQLFMIEPLRYSLLAADAGEGKQDEEQRTENMLWQMQRMFAHLERSERRAFSPRPWCHSFKDMDGNPTSTWVQMDAQEYLTSLAARLEERLRGGSVDGVMAAAIGGREVSVLRRADGLGTPRMASPSPFVTLTCQVRGCGSLDRALELYTTPDRISDYRWSEGDDDEGEVTDVVKRSCIERLSHTVFFQLMRFELDYETFTRVKVDDRFEFPDRVDLFPYTAEGLQYKDELDARHAAAAAGQAGGGAADEGGEDEGKDGEEAPGGAAAGGAAAGGEEDDPSAAGEDTPTDGAAPADDVPSFEDESRRPYTAERPASYYKFRLVGVVVHMGTVESGHYYSLIRERGRRAQSKAASRVSKLRYDAAASARENNRALKKLLRALHKDEDEDEDEEEDGEVDGEEEDEEAAAAQPAPVDAGAQGAAASAPPPARDESMFMGHWFEFNDALVQPVDAARLTQTFGGPPDADDLDSSFSAGSSGNAYMLVYERESELPVDTEVELREEALEAVALTEAEAEAALAEPAAAAEPPGDASDAEATKAKGPGDDAAPVEVIPEGPVPVGTEDDDPEEGALVRAADGTLKRWTRVSTAKRVTRTLRLEDLAPRDPGTGEGSVPAAAMDEVLRDNRRYVRQRHLFDPALAVFMDTVLGQVVAQSMACREAGAPSWPAVPPLIAAAVAEITGAAADAAPGAAPPPQLTSSDRYRAAALVRARPAALDAALLAFPPRVAPSEIPGILAAAGLSPDDAESEAGVQAVRAADLARAKVRADTASTALTFARYVQSRSRRAAAARDTLVSLSQLLALEPRLASKALAVLVIPMYKIPGYKPGFQGPSPMAVSLGRVAPPATLYGKELGAFPVPPVFSLLVHCPDAAVRCAWSDFLTAMLRTTAVAEAGRLCTVKSKVLPVTTFVAHEGGGSGSFVEVESPAWLPATTTGQTVEMLCHQNLMDHAAAYWHQWGDYLAVLSRFARHSVEAARALALSNLPVVITDTLLSKASPIHGKHGVFMKRQRALFHNAKTGARADLTGAVAVLSRLARIFHPLGYSAGGLGLPSTTILLDDDEANRAACRGSQARAMEVQLRLARAESGEAAALTAAERQEMSSWRRDEAAGVAVPPPFPPALTLMLSTPMFWRRLLGWRCDLDDVRALARHFSFGAKAGEAYRAPIVALLAHCAATRSPADVPALAAIAHDLLGLRDGLVDSRARMLLDGYAATAASPSTLSSAYGIVDACDSRFAAFPDVGFELAALIVRLCRTSTSFRALLGRRPRLCQQVELQLQCVAQGLDPTMSSTAPSRLYGETEIPSADAVYERVLDEARSTGAPTMDPAEEAVLVRRCNLRRDWRARHLLTQLGAALATDGVALVGESIVEVLSSAGDGAAAESGGSADHDLGLD